MSAGIVYNHLGVKDPKFRVYYLYYGKKILYWAGNSEVIAIYNLIKAKATYSDVQVSLEWD